MLRHAKKISLAKRFRPRRFGFRACLAIGIGVLGITISAPVVRAATAAEIKAVMLLGFAQLSEWTAETSGPTSFEICLFGNSEIGPALKMAVEGETALGRPIRVQEIESLDAVADCRILYVADQRKSDFAKASSNLIAPNTLLVGDFSGFTQSSGAVEFFSDSGRVRFAVNIDNAESRGIRLSSRILSRARIVETDR